MFTDFEKLNDTVIKNGYCIGCGVCAVISLSPIKIKLDQFGCFNAAHDRDFNDISNEAVNPNRICPFSSDCDDEDKLSDELFSNTTLRDARIGRYASTFAGHVAEGTYRNDGSSGGFASWIAVELFKQKKVDYVVHVGETDKLGSTAVLFEYKISKNIKDIRHNAKTRYYPVEMSKVLDVVKNKPGRYLFVGVPCFIKALRLLQNADPVFKKRIVFTVAIFCGHFKSSRFSDCLAWQCGVAPEDISGIDYRKKIKNEPASHYGVEVLSNASESKEPHVKKNTEFFASNWAYGLFKYKACDYCDDVVGETADVSVGDAWLQGYVKDYRGANVLITRNKEIDLMVMQAIRDEQLMLNPISPDEVYESQAGGFRHRRGGLSYRLFLKHNAGEWSPEKRVEKSDGHLTRKQKEIYRLRMWISEKSHTAFQTAVINGSFEAFCEKMRPLINEYDKYYQPSLYIRTKQRLSKRIKPFLKALLRNPGDDRE